MSSSDGLEMDAHGAGRPDALRGACCCSPRVSASAVAASASTQLSNSCSSAGRLRAARSPACFPTPPTRWPPAHAAEMIINPKDGAYMIMSGNLTVGMIDSSMHAVR